MRRYLYFFFRKKRILLLWFIFFILLLLQLSLFLRNPILSVALQNRVDRFNRAWGGELSVKSARIRGFTSLLVTGIMLKPLMGDTLLRIDTAYVSVNPMKLLTGRISVVEVSLNRTRITIYRQDSLTNYRFLLQKKDSGLKPDTTPPPEPIKGGVNYADASDRMAGLIFDKIPGSLTIRDFTVSSVSNHHRTAFHVDRFVLKGHTFKVPVRIDEQDTSGIWMAEGRIDDGNRAMQVTLYPRDETTITIPFVGYKWNAGISFRVVAFSLVEQRQKDGITSLNGSAYVRGLEIAHQRLAAGKVSFDSLGIDYTINFGEDFMELDSATRIRFNRLDFHPYLRYRPHPTRQVTFQVRKDPFPARDLFSSLPDGLFSLLHGLKVEGELSWYIDFFVDLSQPDSLRFDTELKRHDFRLISTGTADLYRLNGPFEYTAYEKGVPVRSFMVGEMNPEFRPLARISPFLQYAVLTSEDGGFYQHRGFLLDAFRESIITNIKEHRFARGGSTISMQLIKNVFLSRNKTVARKLEEALIVWLIENQGLCTKDRMLEVYLNIIEWGPLIYGAGEGSRYYFNKDPSRLTLAEAIFMASVIPRPKWFRYDFDETGHLRPEMADYYRLVAAKMIAKGWISQSDFDRLIPDVELKGAAKMMLKKTDTLAPADTLAGTE